MLRVIARRGFTLAELMIAILLLGIVGGAIHESLRRQQQVFRSIALVVGMRGNVRDAAEVLAADLAAVSPLDTLPLATDSAVEFFALIGVSVSCDSAPGYDIPLPPITLQSGYRLTALLATPDSGDLLLVYNHDSAATGGQPRWDRHTIAGVASQSAATACPSSTGFTSLADAAGTSYVLTLRGAASGGVRAGAPVRILRRGRYSLYRSGDSRWYLGNRRCNSLGPSACGAIQPLSGPYAAYAGGGQGGVSLSYFDMTGAQVVSSLASPAVTRIDVAVRAHSTMAVFPGATRDAPLTDSAVVSVALRNHD